MVTLVALGAFLLGLLQLLEPKALPAASDRADRPNRALPVAAQGRSSAPPASSPQRQP